MNQEFLVYLVQAFSPGPASGTTFIVHLVQQRDSKLLKRVRAGIWRDALGL